MSGRAVDCTSAIERRSAHVQRAPQMNHDGKRTDALIHQRAIGPLSVYAPGCGTCVASSIACRMDHSITQVRPPTITEAPTTVHSMELPVGASLSGPTSGEMNATCASASSTATASAIVGWLPRNWNASLSESKA